MSGRFEDFPQYDGPVIRKVKRYESLGCKALEIVNQALPTLHLSPSDVKSNIRKGVDFISKEKRTGSTRITAYRWLEFTGNVILERDAYSGDEIEETVPLALFAWESRFGKDAIEEVVLVDKALPSWKALTQNLRKNHDGERKDDRRVLQRTYSFLPVEKILDSDCLIYCSWRT